MPIFRLLPPFSPSFQQNLKIRTHLAAILDKSAIMNFYHDQHIFLKKYLHRNIFARFQTSITIFTVSEKPKNRGLYNWQPSLKKSTILNFLSWPALNSEIAPPKKYICQITDFFHPFHYAFQQNLKIGFHSAAILKKIRHFEFLSWIEFFSEIVPP